MGIFSGLRERLFGRVLPPAPSASAVVGALPLSQQFARIGGNKTPATVSSIIREADAGRPSRLVDLTNDCRQLDHHMQSCLGTREGALATIDLVVAPWVGRDEKEPASRDQDVAWFVREALNGATGDGQDTKGLFDTIQQLQGAICMGYAVDEIEWEKDGRFMMPAGFRPIDQRRFEFRQSDGRLVWSDQWGGRDHGIDLMATYPARFIQHQPRVNGDVPAREGLNKLLVWSATFRNWTLADWLQLAELSWKPWRIGRYSEKAGEADISNLIEALRYLTTNGVAAIRKDHELDIKWPEGSRGGRGNHQALAEWLGAEMSKAILGQTLTVEAGERGARSLGDVHDRVRRDIQERDAVSLAATLMRDLVRWIVWLNFGPETPLPTVSFNTEDAVDLGEFALGLKNLKEAELRVPARWARDKIGIPEPEKDEELLGDWEDADISDLDEAA